MFFGGKTMIENIRNTNANRLTDSAVESLLMEQQKIYENAESYCKK